MASMSGVRCVVLSSVFGEKELIVVKAGRWKMESFGPEVGETSQSLFDFLTLHFLFLTSFSSTAAKGLDTFPPSVSAKKLLNSEDDRI